MQLNRVEAFDLLRFMPTAGAVRFSSDLAALFYDLRERLLEGHSIATFEREWLARYLRNARNTAPQQWAFVHEWVLDPLGQSHLDGLVHNGWEPPFWEDLQPALTMLAPLGRAMMRHTRGLLREYQREGKLGANLARRWVHARPVPLPTTERSVYDALQEYCRELAQRMSANMAESRQRAAIGFYLSFLRQRFSSSFHALQESLNRRLDKIHRTLQYKEIQETAWWSEEELEELTVEEKETLILKNRSNADLTWESQAVHNLRASLEVLPDLPEKTRHLLRIIQERRTDEGERVRQMVVFTRYGDTLSHLYELLTRRLRGCPIGTFSGEGGWVRWGGHSQGKGYDRTAIRRFFLNQEIDVLLCTDAAAEGLNLQCADLLVNFDLPWNPMLLEQRIGRIDRIGQQHERVDVINLLYQGTVEEVVYDRLVQRFWGAIAVAGELQFSLLPIEQSDFEDFAKAEGEDEAHRLDEEALIQRAESKMDHLQQRQKITEFKPAEQKAAYEALARQKGGHEAPVTLEAIWHALSHSNCLAQRGCKVEVFPHGKAVCIQGIPDVPESVLLTTDPTLYEHGLPADDDRQLRFATYGEPIFERLLDFMLAGEQRIANAWHQRQPLKGIRTPSGYLISHAEQLSSDREVGEGSLEAVARDAVSGRQRQPDLTGALQKRLLDKTAAVLAEKKLSNRPETLSHHLEKLEQFRKEREKGVSFAVFRQPIEVAERGKMLAHKNDLLWPLEDGKSNVVVVGDPLLIGAVTSVVERQLQGMKAENRTGPEVARRLRQRVGSEILD